MSGTIRRMRDLGRVFEDILIPSDSEGTTIYFNTLTPKMPDLEAYAPVVLTTTNRVPRENDRFSDTDLLTNKIKSLSMAD